eukprot:TRINITY_DN4262_c0_g1_i3.p1 TRINITY_DN4262_c0_g1~~TRINITY_DN4262_c0_g1_i3.p1  ORF type:complete len:241 (+),score=28.09 TRINITY_DN4262_c0_g1_i3:94-816(+)
MVIFVRGHVHHHRRYERGGRGEEPVLKKKESGVGWKKKVAVSEGNRPHSAPQNQGAPAPAEISPPKVFEKPLQPTASPDGTTQQENYIESRLGIVKKNRRSNSTSSLIGFNCLDLMQEDGDVERRKGLGSQNVDVVKGITKEKRSYSLPSSLTVSDEKSTAPAPPLKSTSSYTTSTSPSRQEPVVTTSVKTKGSSITLTTPPSSLPFVGSFDLTGVDGPEAMQNFNDLLSDFVTDILQPI